MESLCVDRRLRLWVPSASAGLQDSTESALEGSRRMLGEQLELSLLPGVPEYERRCRGVVKRLAAGLPSELQHSPEMSRELTAAAMELSNDKAAFDLAIAYAATGLLKN